MPDRSRRSPLGPVVLATKESSPSNNGLSFPIDRALSMQNRSRQPSRTRLVPWERGVHPYPPPGGRNGGRGVGARVGSGMSESDQTTCKAETGGCSATRGVARRWTMGGHRIIHGTTPENVDCLCSRCRSEDSSMKVICVSYTRSALQGRLLRASVLEMKELGWLGAIWGACSAGK